MQRYPNSFRRSAGTALPGCVVSVAIGLLTCIVPAQATIFASPSSLDFGSVPYLSTSSSRYITVTNSGATTVSGAIEISGDFSDDGSGDCGSSLGPETSCMLGVVFMPSGVGVRNGTISLYGEQSVSLSGTGIDTQKPFAILDAPATVPFGADITLTAAKSFDMGGGTIASYTWTSLTGTGAIAKDTAIVTSVPSLYIPFTPDNPIALGTQTFRLVVTDSSGNASEPVSATFSVIDNQKPLALPGINFVNSSVVGVDWGESFTLTGNRSFDVGGGTLAAYRWKSLTATIPGMQLNQVVETATPNLEILLSQLTPVPAGRYTFELVVIDDSGNLSDPATVDLQVTETGIPCRSPSPATAPGRCTVRQRWSALPMTSPVPALAARPIT